MCTNSRYSHLSQNDELALRFYNNSPPFVSKVFTPQAAHFINSRILVVEDDLNDTELLAFKFEKAQLRERVLFVRTAEEAQALLLASEKASKPTSPFCALFLDLKLPKMSGIALLEILRRHPETESLPVFITSQTISPTDIARCQSLKVIAFTPKPIALTEFCATFAKLLYPPSCPQ